MKISTQEPVNKTAAIVTQKASANNSFDAKADLKYRRSDEVWKAPKNHKRFDGDHTDNLTGKKLLRSVVTGFIGAVNFSLDVFVVIITKESQSQLNQKDLYMAFVVSV